MEFDDIHASRTEDANHRTAWGLLETLPPEVRPNRAPGMSTHAPTCENVATVI